MLRFALPVPRVHLTSPLTTLLPATYELQCQRCGIVVSAFEPGFFPGEPGVKVDAIPVHFRPKPGENAQEKQACQSEYTDWWFRNLRPSSRSWADEMDEDEELEVMRGVAGVASL
jgi:hypothetical protein